MDTQLLSTLIRELILEHDAVTLPGIGTFVAELMPSVFSDKGYTIHPPYRRLSFSQREGSDTLLSDLYARSNNITPETSLRILSGYLQSLREELTTRKTVTFPGLGRLRATRENNFFFIADEDLDIYPEGFGLEPLSLKTHEETPEEVSSAVAGLAASLLESDPAASVAGRVASGGLRDASVAPAPPTVSFVPSGNSSPAGPSRRVGVTGPPEISDLRGVSPGVDTPPEATRPSAPASVQPVAPAGRRRRRWWLWALILILILAALFFAGFFAAATWAPDWLDTLLYSPEELAIIRA